MPKNSIVFKDTVFYLRWYNMMRWSRHICEKSSFLSFCSFLVKFSEWHKGSGRVNFTKYDQVEWGENCHYASDIFFEWPPSLICYFIAILFYIVRKWLTNCLENFSVSILDESIENWKIAEFPKISIDMRSRKAFY